MLYDPKWEQRQANVDPVSLAGLIAWLEKQPKNGTYNWSSIDECLACRYWEGLGYINPAQNKSCPYAQVFGGLGNYGRIAQVRPWTFGGALKRARKVAAE